MNRKASQILLITFISVLFLNASAEIGKQKIYQPGKVIYDTTNSDHKSLSHLLDRAVLLQKIYDNDSFNASIIFVIHEDAVPLFTKSKKQFKRLMQRANSATVAEIIQFRLCLASAKMQGFNKNDFYDFVQLVPMADAEIVELQNQGYAYLR